MGRFLIYYYGECTITTILILVCSNATVILGCIVLLVLVRNISCISNRSSLLWFYTSSWRAGNHLDELAHVFLRLSHNARYLVELSKEKFQRVRGC